MSATTQSEISVRGRAAARAIRSASTDVRDAALASIAARLEAELRRHPGDAAVAERLARTYEAEGRAADAARVGRVNATQRP